MGKFYPKYHLYLSKTNEYLMSCKKQAYNKTANYGISLDKSEFGKKTKFYIGKVKLN